MGLVHPELGTPRMGRGERVRYVPNHRSFGAFIRSDQMRDATADAAQDIAALATAMAPSSDGGEDSEGFRSRVKSGYRVQRAGGFLRVGGNYRVRVLVTNDVEGSALLEFGARGLKRYRVLGRAGAKIGTFKPEGGAQ